MKGLIMKTMYKKNFFLPLFSKIIINLLAKRKIYILSLCLVLGFAFAFSIGFFCKDVKAENNDLLHKYYTSYKVETGDSLWTIADSHYDLGYDNHAEYIDEVMSINHLKNADDIISGETLIIPYYSYDIK